MIQNRGRELTRIFHYSAAPGQKDLEDAKLAIGGLEGKPAAIILKGDSGTMIRGRIHIPRSNEYVFALKRGDKTGYLKYENILQVWY